MQLWMNIYRVLNSGEATLSLRLEGAQARLGIKAGRNGAVRPREGPHERRGREIQPGLRLVFLSGVGNSEGLLMEWYVLPLRRLWESQSYDKFRVKMRIERKERKAKGQNRRVSTLFSLFSDLLKFGFSMGRAPGRPRADGKSSVFYAYLSSVSLW